jgi:hypothetical protein
MSNLTKEDAVERLEALLGVMDATQGEDSEYSGDCRLGIARIKELEKKLSEEYQRGYEAGIKDGLEH